MRYLSFLLILVIFGCKDKKKDNNGLVYANVNGIEFNSISGSYQIQDFESDSLFEIKTVISVDGASGERFEISFPGNDIGNYNLVYRGVPGAIYFDVLGTPFPAITGYLNIIKINEAEKTIFGDFEFEGRSDVDASSVTITGGQLNEIPLKSN